MKINAEWINDWLTKPLPEKQLLDSLERGGVELEQYVASTSLDEKIIVGLAKTVSQHPNADRLHLVDLEIGGGEVVRVVCGAPNVRDGLKVVFAQVGAELPDGTVLREAKIRGEISHGMLCSAMELGLGDDHNGIIELDADAVVGSKVADIFKKHAVIDVKTQANRPDLQSMVGLAREAAAMTGGRVKALPEAVEPSGSGWAALTEDMAASRFHLTRLSVDATKESPEWMKLRLESCGVRPISLIVDITNYVCLELGQPTHAYDAAKVQLPLGARKAEAGEKLVTLDGTERKLTADDLVIVDGGGVIGLAGVMGGLDSEVTAETTEILLEAAVFDGATVRKTAKRHGIRTEASARFERGLPVRLPLVATARAVQLLVELAGAKVLDDADSLTVWPWVQRVGLRMSALNRLLGFEVTAEEAIAALAGLEIDARRFDVAAEARGHLGAPYKWGAKFRTDGVSAFDCSYLTDYMYSLIGVGVGHTASAQFNGGRAVEVADLQPGDLLFRGGPWEELDEKERGGVSHVAVYVGDGRIVHAVDYQRDAKGEWQKLAEVDQKVVEEPMELMTADPQYLGARRHVENAEEYLSVQSTPWWRPDLKEGQDLVEEVVRVLGYDRVPSKIPAWRPNDVNFDTKQAKLRRLRALLSGAGLFEVMTYSFVSDEQIESVGLDPKDQLRVKNPLSSEQNYLRPMLLPSHLQVAAKNRTYDKEFGFFEISKVFTKTTDGEQPVETLRLGIMTLRKTDAYRFAKGILDAVMKDFAISPALSTVNSDIYAPGRLAKISVGKRQLGTIGQISPALARKFKLTGELAYADLDVEVLVDLYGDAQLRAIGKFPGTSRDLSLLVSDEVSWQEVVGFASSLNLGRIEFVNDYYGDDLAKNTKSLALRLYVEYPDKTPTDADADRAEKTLAEALTKKFGATLR
jgi:phenylalanyl-tRNA synthetase beta subunit